MLFIVLTCSLTQIQLLVTAVSIKLDNKKLLAPQRKFLSFSSLPVVSSCLLSMLWANSCIGHIYKHHGLIFWTIKCVNLISLLCGKFMKLIALGIPVSFA